MVNKFLYPNGGSETYMLELGRKLAESGHQIEYFGMDSDSRCVSNSAESYTKNVDFHTSSALDKIKNSLKTIYSKEAQIKIAKVLDSFKPDIVHLNNINFQLTPSIIYEIKKRNIPIVQTVHDGQIACPNHSLYIDSRGEACTRCLDGKYYHCIENKCLHNSLLKSVIAAFESYLYHAKNTYNLVDKYICPSRFIADIIIKGGVEKRRIAVLHNFCKKSEISLLEKDLTKKYVLFFGRLEGYKGVKTLADVCKELGDIHFVFAGTGPLEDYCNGIDNIELVGFKSGDELERLISNASFSVCPSECHENCPMSVIESKALATPVIVSNLGGAPELVDAGKTGFVFEAGNKDELKKAIRSLYDDEKLIKTMSENCVSSSKNTIEAYEKKLIEIYNEVSIGDVKN